MDYTPKQFDKLIVMCEFFYPDTFINLDSSGRVVLNKDKRFTRKNDTRIYWFWFCLHCITKKIWGKLPKIDKEDYESNSPKEGYEALIILIIEDGDLSNPIDYLYQFCIDNIKNFPKS